MSEKENFMSKVKEYAEKFFENSYGADSIYYCCLAICAVLIFFNLFIKSVVITVLVIAIILVNSWRAFSWQKESREKEEQLFKTYTKPLRHWFRFQKRKITEKDYAFKKCPQCNTTLRLPKNKGKHNVKCPKCGNVFEVRI